MILQIAERGGIAVTAREEMLIDAQNRRTQRIRPFRSQSFQHPLKPPLHGRGADPFTLTQPSSADPVPVPEEDHAAEPFGGSLPFENPWKLLAEVSPACMT